MKVRIMTVFVLNACVAFVAAALFPGSTPAEARQENQTDRPATVVPADLTAAPGAAPMAPLIMQRLEAMQAHWERMRQTQDPAVRLRLMQEHRETMRETATMMRGIMHAQGMMPLLERLEAMQAEMDEILATEDADQRSELIQKHLEKMRETNAMLRSMMGGGGRMAMKGGAGQGPMGGMGGGHGQRHAMMSAKGPMHAAGGGHHGRIPSLENLRQMRGDLDEILETEDPAERQELLLALGATLDETIAQMANKQGRRGKKHGMMSGQHKMHGKMHAKNAHPDDSFHERVEKRLELIQSLVEQLLEYHIRD